MIKFYVCVCLCPLKRTNVHIQFKESDLKIVPEQNEKQTNKLNVPNKQHNINALFVPHLTSNQITHRNGYYVACVCLFLKKSLYHLLQPFRHFTNEMSMTRIKPETEIQIYVQFTYKMNDPICRHRKVHYCTRLSWHPLCLDYTSTYRRAQYISCHAAIYGK